MSDDAHDAEVSRRSVLRSAGGAAAGGVGLAAASGTASAGGKHEIDCPTCREDAGGPTRYRIAHRPPGNPEQCIDLCLPEPAARAHLEQHEHDCCGPCPDGEDKQKKKKKKRKKK